MCVRVLCIGVRVCFSPPCGKASHRRHTCLHLARRALTGSGKGNVRVVLLPPLLPGDLAFSPDCGLSSPTVKVPFPKVACIAASQWRAALGWDNPVACPCFFAPLPGCLPFPLLFSPFPFSANFPRRSSSFCPSHRHEMHSLTHHCTKDDLGTLWKTGLWYFAAWSKVVLHPLNLSRAVLYPWKVRLCSFHWAL